MQTILIVEDDDALRSGLEFDLAEEKYVVIGAHNKETALEHIDYVDLALLDIILPDTDGFELCREIKSRKNIPVIFLTCKDMEADELEGFSVGADDYITKPFSLPILRKRIAAVLKRDADEKEVYSDGFLTVDFTKMAAYAGSESISFTPTEYKLLKAFIYSKGSILTRRLLLEKLWDNEGNFVDEHTLTVNINRIRGKIEDKNHKYIKTVYGVGYVWNGESL